MSRAGRVNPGKGKFVTQSQAQFVLDNASWSDNALSIHLGIPQAKVRQIRAGRLWAKLRPNVTAATSPTPVQAPRVAPLPVRSNLGTSSSSVRSGVLPVAKADEPFIGFRVWNVGDDGQPRATAHTDFVWKKSITAKCQNYSSHQAPESGCECGIHANNSLRTLEERFGHSPLDGIVVGAIKLTGRVVEATAGFRAEKAEVIAVAMPVFGGGSGSAMIAATVGFNLGVPVVPYATLEAYAAEYGQLRDAAMLNKKASRVNRHLKADRSILGEGAGPVRCSRCANRFPTTDAMLDHIISDHKGEK